MLEWWLEPPVVLRELLHVHVDDLVEQREGVHLPSRRPAVHLRTKCRLTNISTVTAAINAMRAPVTLRLQPLTAISTVVGTMARGRVARKVPRRTNSDTPPRPRRCADLGSCPQDPCPALKSGAACAISPGNPSLCRSSCPSSPPSPPGTSSGSHRSAGSAEALPGTKMRPLVHLTIHAREDDGHRTRIAR